MYPQEEPNTRHVCGPVPAGYARCNSIVRTDVRYDVPPEYHASAIATIRDAQTAAAMGALGPLGPAQLRQAYNLPSKTAGKGQTVAVVDAYDNPTAESDLAAYRKQFGLPACTTKNGCFRKLNQDGNASPLPPKATGNLVGWAGEMSLDLDMVSAICPNCKIVLIETKTQKGTDLGAGVTGASKAGASQISNSYGIPECYYNQQNKLVCSSPASLAKYYNVPKTIVTASSGDSAWFAGPQAPADFGTVVSVGGTSLYPFNSSRGWIETAWHDAGSSCSKYIKRPSWVPSSTGCPGGARPIADVSAVADPFTGVLVYQTYPYSRGGFYVYGGTSVASPIIAAVYALAGNASSQNFGAALYKSGASVFDVLIGNNGVIGFKNNAGQTCTPTKICTSGPGWDGPTGVGTPNGLRAF
jgi:subtilase family serine protease